MADPRLNKNTLTKMMRDPPERWHGRCHEASVAVAMLIHGATVERGYWVGRTAPGSYFAGVGRPILQHSWVRLTDGRVLDPTRFAFTNDPAWPPWIGGDEDYDVGGCRSQGPDLDVPSPYDYTNWLGEETDPIVLELDSYEYVLGLFGNAVPGHGGGWVELTVRQVYWLANLPVKDQEGPGVLARFYAAEVYEAIARAGHGAAIPIDRRNWILAG